MTTNELIRILKRELGTVESNNRVDKARNEIIQRLYKYDELKIACKELVDTFYKPGVIELLTFLKSEINRFS